MKLAIDTNAYRLMMDAEPAAVRLVRAAERLLMPVPVIGVPYSDHAVPSKTRT